MVPSEDIHSPDANHLWGVSHQGPSVHPASVAGERCPSPAVVHVVPQFVARSILEEALLLLSSVLRSMFETMNQRPGNGMQKCRWRRSEISCTVFHFENNT